MNDAVINPLWTEGCPRLGPLSLMVSTRADLKIILGQTAGILMEAKRAPMMSKLYGDEPANRISVAGPMMGAPYAVALMETLIAWGARRIFFIGWCGSISPDVSIGDMVLVTSGLIDEGTSLHYGRTAGEIVSAHPDAVAHGRQILSGHGLEWREGCAWTTDAPFRETPEKVMAARERGGIVVDMEASALFTVAAFRGVEAAAVMVVSDDLSTLSWKPGFKDPRFRSARRALCEGFARLCRTR